MNPTSTQLITAIADALRTRIAPLLSDQPWPASELRSIDALLTHLAARVEHEHTVLIEDNADLDAVLGDLTAAGVAASMTHPSPDPATAPDSLDSLHSDNLTRRAALEAVIHLIHDGTHQPQIELVRSYLRRAAERDQLIFGPFATSLLF